METSIPTPEALIATSIEYAKSALDAHDSKEYGRIVLLAGTALEHLTKACLVRRHPTLILDLRHPQSWKVLRYVLASKEVPPERIRTIGLHGALERANELIDSDADPTDIATLVELRNGQTHLGTSSQLEERILIAFLRQIDACLRDLNLSQGDFWGKHLPIVEAFLSNEIDRVKKLVSQKISRSEYQFRDLEAKYSEDVLEVMMRGSYRPTIGEEPYSCPVCGSEGIAIGDHEIGWDVTFKRGEIDTADQIVEFTANSFSCGVCGLYLSSEEEIKASGLKINHTPSFDVDELQGGEYFLGDYEE
ncbi:MAG: hypothetical protein WA090_03110 [Candidatus Nanopelagicaceae bacterium]